MSAGASRPDAAPLRAAGELLRARGFDGAHAGSAGRQGEILVVEVPAPDLAALAELAPELKALGFRYVAVDLARVAEAAVEDPTAPGA